MMLISGNFEYIFVAICLACVTLCLVTCWGCSWRCVHWSETERRVFTFSYWTSLRCGLRRKVAFRKFTSEERSMSLCKSQSQGKAMHPPSPLKEGEGAVPNASLPGQDDCLKWKSLEQHWQLATTCPDSSSASLCASLLVAAKASCFWCHEILLMWE